MYEYLRIMKKAYLSANTIFELNLLKHNYSASLYALYKAGKISLDMWEFLILKNDNLWLSNTIKIPYSLSKEDIEYLKSRRTY